MVEANPIRSEADYNDALVEVERLFDAPEGTPASDRLEVLTALVEDYESRHYRLPMPDPIEALRYHMESRGLTRRDLEPYLGSAAQVTQVLNRRRALSITMIRRLHKGLGISADVLIQPYPLEKTPRPTRMEDRPAYG